MTWKEKTVVAILLLVARMLCEDSVYAQEIKTLATHIGVNAPKAGSEGGERG